MFRRKIFVIAGIALFLAVSASITAASDQSKDTPQKPAAAAVKQPAAPEAGARGMRVFIDPATGKIREPEQSDIQQLAPAAPAFHPLMAPAAPLQGPGGAVGMKLDDNQMVYSVATKNPDGSVSFECVTGPANAAKVLAGKPGERSQSDVK